MFRVFCFCLFAYITASLCSCAPTKAYHGPELPEAELASVYFFANQSLSLTGMKIDEFDVGTFDWGIRVPEGEHTFEFRTRYQNNNEQGSFSQALIFPPLRCKGIFKVEKGRSYKIIVNYGGAVVQDEEDYTSVGSAGCERLWI